VEYSPGRFADVFGDATQPTILLWHGAVQSRAVVRPLAGAEYDPVADRYQPAKGGPAQHAAGEVAARIAAILGR
jgi:hypothetical protein